MLTISEKHLQCSMHALTRKVAVHTLRRRKVAVSQRFLTKSAVRQEFKAWNRNWHRSWRMRIVLVDTGGYAGVLWPKKGV